jgi:uncharacterized protein (TIGR03437 family)
MITKAFFLSMLCALASAQTFINLANMDSANANPAILIQGSDGNFYGATAPLDPFVGSGVVFKLTPSGTVTTLYTFTPAWATSLIQGADGNLYGTTHAASGNYGTVFRMTTAGNLTMLYTFSGKDGLDPTNLVQGSDGNFYGVTNEGGNTGQSGDGTVFKITPAGVLTTLHNFTAGADGAFPTGLIQAKNGNFYGTTQRGGNSAAVCPYQLNGVAGCGVVFQITPAGVLSVVHAFDNLDGEYPSNLIQASNGMFYGITAQDGPNMKGTIFSMTPGGAVTYLDDNAIVVTTIIPATDGNLYGVAASGILFEMTPSGTLSTLHTFCGEENCGSGPAGPSGLIQGSDGNLYGTTIAGTAADGTVFEWSFTNPDIPAISSTNGVLNGASFQPGVAPDSWITISGTNLSTTTDTWANAIVNGALPTTLDGVSVMVGGQPAYIEYISPTQINAVAPNVPAGSVQVTVTNVSGTGQAAAAQLSAEQPAFFQWGTYAVATRQDFSLAVKNGTFAGTTTVPAAPGDVIILWGTGFGPTSPSAPSGIETPSTTTYNTATPATVKIGTQSATVYGAALAPGYAGLYQVAIQIPASLANGDYPVVAAINGASSPLTTMITVQQ